MQKNLHKKKNDAHGCNGTALRNVGNYDVFASEMLILNSYSIQNQTRIVLKNQIASLYS